MAAGDFLLVVPPEWFPVPNSGALLNGWGIEGIRSDIAQQQWGGIDALIEAEGMLPAGQTVIEAKLVEATSGGDDEPRLWVLFGPLNP